MSHAVRGYWRWTGHSEEFWQNMVHWSRQGVANHSLASRTLWTVRKHKKIWHWKMSPLRLEDVQYATGEKWRAITNSSRKNEVAGPKWKWCAVVDVPDGDSKVCCCEEQYCIETWNVRSMNQDKLGVVKQEMARLNVDIRLRNQWTKVDSNGRI